MVMHLGFSDPQLTTRRGVIAEVLRTASEEHRLDV